MIVLLIVLIAVLAIVQYRSTINPFDGIKFDYQCSKLLVEPDEEFEVVTTITNTKLRFVPYIKMNQIFPSSIKVRNLLPDRVSDMGDHSYYSASLYLMPRSKYIRKVSGVLPRRGCHTFQGANLLGGDFMGFSEHPRRFPAEREIVVYPKAVDVGNVDIVMGGIMGDISVRRLVMEDPVLIAGFRDYSGREPMKAISWNHSARVGKLMVRQFDHTIDPAISIMLDVEDKIRAGSAERKELAFSMTRSVCQNLENQGMKYDFITNSTTADAFSKWSYMPESIGLRHFSVIMEGLGRADYNHTGSLRRLAERFVEKRLYDRFVILVTVKSKADVSSEIAAIENNIGGKVFVMSAEEFCYELDTHSEAVC